MTYPNRYVAGFMFDPNLWAIALIKKEKPKWQKGLFNGIGGHIENSESPKEAMVREFKEETGLYWPSWYNFARLHRPNNFELFFYRTICPKIDECKTTTLEEVHILDIIEELDYSKAIPNLRWLIPLALDTEVEFTDVKYG